ncbi:MAG: branched-chain amino acid ABC transporter substrate-binding protein [Solirubrobacteraceae bacterium]
MFARAAIGCLLAGSVISIAACGSSSSSSKSSGGGGNTVDVYSSLPLQGASSAQTTPLVNGIKLALEQAGNKAGKFTVNYQSLDDSTAQAGKWDPGQVAADARKAAQDPKTVFYIGEFNSGASAISIPILNQAGIAQLSPANTAVGLTTTDPGHQPGEPTKYYPTGKRNYVRIVPRDTIQGAALLTTMKSDGCTKIAVANDKEVYGQGLATVMGLQKAKFGLDITSNTGIDPTAPNFRSYAQTIKAQGADCFVFSGIVSNGAVQLTKDVAAALPKAKIYGPDGVCTGSYTNPAKKGISADIDPRVKCTVATLDLQAYPGGKAFLTAYNAKYGGTSPDPYAIYGYEAMKVALDTLAGAGAKGNDKGGVIAALFATKARSSVLGSYGFDPNGDTTLKSYGVYKVGPDGDPKFLNAVTPSS